MCTVHRLSLIHIYAIEYDNVDPTALNLSLEVRALPGLYLAGQVNGSSGYEEAAAQGLIAGINAVRKLNGQDPVPIDRSPVSYTHLDVYKRQEHRSDRQRLWSGDRSSR